MVSEVSKSEDGSGLTSSDGCHCILHGWVGERQDSGKGVVDAHRPGHSLLTLDGGEHFGGVLEGDGSFAQGIHDCEEVDESVMSQRDTRMTTGNGLTRRQVQFGKLDFYPPDGRLVTRY